MSDLVVIVPSRSRPGNIERLWKAWDETCWADTRLVVGLDADDPTKDLYPEGPDYVVDSGLRYVVAWMNRLAKEYKGVAPCIGTLGDDNVPMTPGWDREIIAALEITPFAFANDLYPRAPGSLSCHVFMRDEVLGRLGYFGTPEILHMYVDVAWMAWGKKCGITYLHDVIIDHRHFTAGKSHGDDVYYAAHALIPSDLQRWHHYCRSGGLNADIAKIDPKASPFTPEEIAEFNTGLFIPESM